MKKILACLMLMSLTLTFMGCGETFNGLSKDANRMGKGIRTIFIRDSN